MATLPMRFGAIGTTAAKTQPHSFRAGVLYVMGALALLLLRGFLEKEAKV